MTLIDVTYGNVAQEQADRMVAAAESWDRNTSHGDQMPAGATEPWITDLLGALLRATGIPFALETGAFQGHTTVHLANCLTRMGGGRLIACEIDKDRAEKVVDLLADDYPKVQCFVECADALSVIRSLPDRSLGLAWVDDDHTMEHVSNEVAALWQKMAPRGIIALHDVYGVCDLRKVVGAYGGFCLDLPRCGPAGGLGLIQPIR